MRLKGKKMENDPDLVYVRKPLITVITATYGSSALFNHFRNSKFLPWLKKKHLGDWSSEKDCCLQITFRQPVRKPLSLDSEDGFGTGCRNFSRDQQSFSGLQLPTWCFSIRVCYSWVQSVFLFDFSNHKFPSFCIRGVCLAAEKGYVLVWSLEIQRV